MSNYRQLLILPGARLSLFSITTARFANVIGGLGLLFTIISHRHSLALGGSVAGAVGLCYAAAGQLQARMIDRYGWVALRICAFLALLIWGLLGLVIYSSLPGILLIAIAGAYGFCAPNITLALRTVLRSASDVPTLRLAGAASESMSAYISSSVGSALGALLVSNQKTLLIAFIAAPVISCLATAFFSFFSPAHQKQDEVDHPKELKRRHWLLPPPRLTPLLVLCLPWYIAVGSQDILSIGFRQEGSLTGSAFAIAIAMPAVGGAIGAFFIGSRKKSHPEHLLTWIMLGAGTILIAQLALTQIYVPLLSISQLLFGVASGVGAVLILNSIMNLASRELASGVAWLMTTTVAGFSLGRPLAGFIIDHGSAQRALAIYCLLPVVSALGVRILTSRTREATNLTPAESLS